MMTHELTFLKAKGVFDRIARFLEQAFAKSLRLDEIERQLKTELAEAGHAFLEEFVEASGDGDVGETVTCEDRELKRSTERQRRRYQSIFGELSIWRYVYTSGKKKPIEYSPLDAQLGLPRGEISYVLEDYLQRLCVQTPYGKSIEDLQAILGTGVSVATAERMTQQLGDFAERYRLRSLTEEETPAPEDEEELLVVAADGKGVVMRKTLAERLEAEKEASLSGSRPEAASGRSTSTVSRRGGTSPRSDKAIGDAKKSSEEDEGSKKKKSRKQMAYVGAVYTIAPFVRTADEILDEVLRRERAKDRPRPQNKRVWGEMSQLMEEELIDGRSKLFLHLAVECRLRDPNREKPLICLMDGEKPLWSAKDEWLDRAVEVLDFFHVLEHLWKMGRGFLTGRSLRDFVEHHARMMLEGKTDYAVRSLRRLIKVHKLKGDAKKEMERGIGYFRRNRQRMRYDEYLANGYPIGSGVAEGTCRNLVKDRMELTGMRWELRGAQAMIYLRALYLNDEWNDFVSYRVQKEQNQLYGEGTAYSKVTPYAQAP